MSKLIILLSILLVSCGKIKVETQVPTDFKVGLDFQAASDFCDTRYGVGTEASEECFLDYRQFFSPKLKIDFTSIENFCKTNYTNEEDILGCQTDLLDIIRGGNS